MNGKNPRITETRSAEKRPAGWLPPNAMPTDISLGPDVKVRWIRQYINGAEEDQTNFFRRAERGWTPVTVEELPRFKNLKNANNQIAMAGCILCKIDAAVAAMDVQYYEDMAIGQANGAKSSFLNDQDERMPKFSEGGKSRVIRGRVPTNA